MKKNERLPKLEVKTSVEDKPQIKPSTLDFLLFHFKVKSDFSSQRLSEEIIDFDTFITDHEAGSLDLRDKAQEFIDHRAWTGDAAENFRIGSAVYKGWLLIFGRVGIENLIAKKDERGEDWIYQYECPQCSCLHELAKGILHKRRLSQYLYDRLEEDEARKTLLGKEIKRCRDCKEFVEFKKIKTRRDSWTTFKQFQKSWKNQQRRSQVEIPLSPEQLREVSDAYNAWDKDIAPRYEKITTNMFRKGIDDTISALNQLWRDAKLYMERFSKPFGIRLCARRDCLRFLPQGSRSSKKYCSGECNAVEKSRRARRR